MVFGYIFIILRSNENRFVVRSAYCSRGSSPILMHWPFKHYIVVFRYFQKNNIHVLVSIFISHLIDSVIILIKSETTLNSNIK